MHLSAVDQMANNGSSVFHRAGVPSKLLLVLVLLVSIIGTGHIIYLGVLSALQPYQPN
jgi:cobalt/nickel transport system permease protein